MPTAIGTATIDARATQASAAPSPCTLPDEVMTAAAMVAASPACR